MSDDLICDGYDGPHVETMDGHDVIGVEEAAPGFSGCRNERTTSAEKYPPDRPASAGIGRDRRASGVIRRARGRSVPLG